MRARPTTPWLLYLGLTGVVWGLFVPDEGLWLDDVQNLFRAFVARERGEGLFPVIATPTRRLLALPFIAARVSGWPVQALHLLSSAAWLATALLAERLARRLWPQRPLAAPLAGALTLCATPDFFTAAPVAVGYQMSIVLYLAAALLGLVWLQSGSRAALLAAPLALSGSLWTSDVAVAVWPLTPLLWAVVPRAPRPRAVATLALLWFLIPVPYVIVLARVWAAGSGYLQQALVPLGAEEWLARFVGLMAWNFTPWRWALDRPLWFPPPGAVVPPFVRWTIALVVGTLATAALSRRATDGEVSAAGARAALAALGLMAAANAPFAGVQYAELYWRTHLLSRVFASLALAWVIALAWSRARGAMRGLVAAAVAAWLSLGVAGALERQDYLVAYTRAYRQELSSILAAAPALAPDAVLLLRIPAQPPFLATEAAHLARAWMVLLHEDSSMECRTVIWSETPATTCASGADGFVCRGERSPDCQRRDGRQEQLLPYERLVVLEYRPGENRYALAETLPAVPPAAARYRPREQIRPGPRTHMARALLDGSRGLAAWLWP